MDTGHGRPGTLHFRTWKVTVLLLCGLGWRVHEEYAGQVEIHIIVIGIAVLCILSFRGSLKSNCFLFSYMK